MPMPEPGPLVAVCDGGTPPCGRPGRIADAASTAAAAEGLDVGGNRSGHLPQRLARTMDMEFEGPPIRMVRHP
jgi:hypothetical protein